MPIMVKMSRYYKQQKGGNGSVPVRLHPSKFALTVTPLILFNRTHSIML